MANIKGGLMIFVCDPWESYMDQLQADSEAQEEQRNRDEDLSYLLPIYEEVESEVICGAVALDCLPVETT